MRSIRVEPVISTVSILLMLILSYPVQSIEETDRTPFLNEPQSVLNCEQYGTSEFVENLGQWEDTISFIAETGFGQISLTPSSMMVNLIESATDETVRGNVLRYDFIDTNHADPLGFDLLSGISNYFKGDDERDWVTGAGRFSGVHYEDLWTGIDLDVVGDGPKYEFTMEPFSDPSDIMMRLSGHISLSVDGNALQIQLENGMSVEDTGLKAYYRDLPEEEIDVEFLVIEEDTFTFELGEYDASRAVVIDPILKQSTFIGGTGVDSIGRSVVDEDGYVYTVGSTWSLDFPVTEGAYCINWSTFDNIVVFKIDPTLKNLSYSTYISGADMDYGYSIALCGDGDVIVAGHTLSTDFPTTEGAYDRSLFKKGYERFYDLFVLRLNVNGTDLEYSTYVGDYGTETFPVVSVDNNGRAFVAATVSTGNFTTTSGAYSRDFSGISDIGLFVLNPSGSGLDYSTFIGGSGFDEPADMVLSGDHLVYLTGRTNSTDMPTTQGAYDRSYNANKTDVNPFVLCFNLTKNDLEFSTYMSIGEGKCIALDDDGNIYVGGSTSSWRFKTTEGAFQTNLSRRWDGILFKLDPWGQNLIYSTFIGGLEYDYILDLGVNSTGSAFITGRTMSKDFPCTQGAYDVNISTRFDVFISSVLPDGSDLVYSSFLGGTSDDLSCSINLLDERTACITGSTYSSDFPTLSGSYSSGFKGATDYFISIMNCSMVELPPAPPLNLTGRMEGGKVYLEWLEPDWDGNCPILGYNISRGYETGHKTFLDSSPSTYFIDDDVDVTKTYSYYVTSNNIIGTSTTSNWITVKEAEPPQFVEDLTTTNIVPGQELTFSVKVKDNGILRKVNLIFSLDQGPSSNFTIFNQGDDLYSLTTFLPDSEFTLSYRFYALDSKGNQNSTGEKIIPVRGSFLPRFLEDFTPSVTRSYKELKFSTTIIDNWGVGEAYLEYWINEGYHRNRTMGSDDDQFFHRITVTGMPGDILHYVFSAKDLHGNWNSTVPMTVQIIDDTPPILLEDITPEEGTTGDPFTFLVEAADDHIGTEVRLTMRIGEGDIDVIEMKMGNGSLFFHEVLLPHTNEDLQYCFELEDHFGNTCATGWRNVSIRDNDPPVFNSDESELEALSGSYFRFSCDASDNIGLEKVSVQYWFDQGSRITVDLRTGGMFFNYMIKVPEEMTRSIHYIFLMEDTSGNFADGPILTTGIRDGLPPKIRSIDDVTIYSGEELIIEADVSDNIGIAMIYWSGLPFGGNLSVWSGILSEEGENVVVVTAEDLAGNKASETFYITVLPVDYDWDEDTIPDLLEIELGLDPRDRTDGGHDLDHDGLSNFWEYKIGTLLDLADTDDDSMPDGWEVEYDLDPLTPSGENDADEDGFTDLEEYINGTDPRVAEIEEDEKGYRMFSMLDIALLILLLTMCLILISVLIKRRRLN